MQKNSLFALSDILQEYAGEARKIPPLAQWNPAYCGEIAIEIKANGDWYHEGVRMTRQKLVDLFSSVLWREGDEYFLKTPVEKMKIRVEDAPLFIHRVERVALDDGALAWFCFTKTGDQCVLGAQHSIEMRAFCGQTGEVEQRPYVYVRDQLWALVGRNAFYHMIADSELSESEQETCLKVSSAHVDFYLKA